MDVSASKRRGLALLAATLGWLWACLVGAGFFWGLGCYQDHKFGLPYRAPTWLLSPATGIFWLGTGLVTLLVTAALILPYVSLRSCESLLREPWRLYVEPACAGLACMAGLCLRKRPTALYDPRYRSGFVGLMAIALITSSLSSYFFLHFLRRTLRSAVRSASVPFP